MKAYAEELKHRKLTAEAEALARRLAAAANAYVPPPYTYKVPGPAYQPTPKLDYVYPNFKSIQQVMDEKHKAELANHPVYSGFGHDIGMDQLLDGKFEAMTEPLE